MANRPKTAIVTGASQGIGAKIVESLLARGYAVVASSRRISTSGAFEPSDRLAMVDGDIGDPRTAASIADTALARFGAIDAVVNNAGIFFTRPFLEYTIEDLRSLIATNVEGFVHVSQRAIAQMLTQESGGSIVSITTSLVEHPIVGVNASIPMITKGGLEAITRSLALEYAKRGIRVNAVAPGQVDTPMHAEHRREHLETLSPMGKISDAKDVADAVLYLLEAARVTGEVLHVDGGAHVGKW
jgi:NAD(P)-dependent dehydrogenase (short-subunit alcohol dehydrogenase family)